MRRAIGGSRRWVWLGTAVAISVLATSCAGDGESGVFAGRQLGEWNDVAMRSDNPASTELTVRGSVNQVTVWGTEPDSPVSLIDSDGSTVDSGRSDVNGALVFRKVSAGEGYTVTATPAAEPAGAQSSSPVSVSDVEGSTPPDSFYADQQISEGFGYITTRDGTTLSATTYLPPGDGPFPTLVEYSGYNPSDPTQDLLGAIEDLGIDASTICETVKIICAKPAQPSSLIAAAMGYAVVAVNIRGTGCSGGSYDFFEPLQLLDGYDVIEAVAAQPWVRNHRVGMIGLSYPGISQLFVASTQPPSLAAITPLSVYDDTGRGILAPGGIFNSGFALSWAEEVLNDAVAYGQGWEQEVVDGGDEQCADNQLLRGQNVDAVQRAQRSEFYDPDIADPVNPTSFVDRINVPVFMTGAWQDEQTGPRFVNLWNRFTSAPVKKFYAFNGAHADGYAPETLIEWKAFLDFYVAGERTPLPDFLLAFGPQLIGDTFGTSLPFPPDRLLEGDFDELRAQFEAEPEVNILWDRGSDPSNLGAPVSTGSSTFTQWPPSSTQPRTWYLQPDGLLGDRPPTAATAASRWTADPELATLVTLPGDKGGQAFDVAPEFEWNQDLPGDASVFVTAPLGSTVPLLGAGSLDLWLRSTEPVVDIGVTVSEVRPDGRETYVQTGVLRSTVRRPGPFATALNPAQTGFEQDAELLVPGEWTEVRVPILPVGHVLRAGSRLRISIHTPGGDRPRWAWIVDRAARPVVDIGHDRVRPSRLVLATVPDATGFQAQLPPCPSLRGQPCRQYVPYSNQGTPDP